VGCCGLKSAKSISKLALTALGGTSIEWYDFFLYSTAAALVFPTTFFPKDMAPLIGLLADRDVPDQPARGTGTDRRVGLTAGPPAAGNKTAPGMSDRPSYRRPWCIGTVIDPSAVNQSWRRSCNVFSYCVPS